ncbi:hypothetical protein BD770DRAFT_407459 [Pilaira anomala]|nr:hypothetical protein BD770DRAFT_407459 [Pilaira anomala]
MPSLPFEILKHIFNCLEKKDLLNCQLISKEWNETSTELPYSDVSVTTYCQQLKKVQINLCSSEVESAMIEPRTIINSRPDIHEFQCSWEIINRESQLRYSMQKFTNLKSLMISCFTTVSNPCPTDIMIDFLHYILDVPFFIVTLPLKMEDLTMAWTTLIGMNDRQRKVGSMIRSPGLPDYLSRFGMDSISKILQSCPSLEGLALHLSTVMFLSSDIEFTCTKLKKKVPIVIGDVDTLSSFFSFISSKLPNIKHIQ